MKFNIKNIQNLMQDNKKTAATVLVAVIIIFGLATKQITHADNSTEKGLFGGALTGAAIGGIAGGGRGAGIGALTGAAVGGLIGSSKDRERKRNRNPREARLDDLYKRRDKLEKKKNSKKTSEGTRIKQERELRDIDQQIDAILDRNGHMQRGGYARY